jgi:hypothetical protein
VKSTAQALPFSRVAFSFQESVYGCDKRRHQDDADIGAGLQILIHTIEFHAIPRFCQPEPARH